MNRNFAWPLAVACLVMSGCAMDQAVVQKPAEPSYMPLALTAAPNDTTEVEATEGDWIHLRYGPYLVALQAAMNNGFVAVQTRVTNLSESDVEIRPSDISLVDAVGEVCRPIEPESVVAPHLANASRLEARATASSLQSHIDSQVMNQENLSYDAQRRVVSKNKSERYWQIGRNLQTSSTALGSSLQAYADVTAAQAERSRVDQYVSQVRSQALTPSRLPPGSHLEGIVFFQIPKTWPGVIQVRVNGRRLAAQAAPSPR